MRDGRQHLFPNLVDFELSGDIAHDRKSDRTGGKIEPAGPDLHGNLGAVTTQELALGAPRSRYPESRDLGLGLVQVGQDLTHPTVSRGIQVVPEHAAGGRVGFDEAALRVNNQNRVRNTFEQTLEPDLRFLGLETGGTLGVLQVGVRRS